MITTEKLFQHAELLRKDLGVSIAEAAGLAGVAPLTWKRWKAGVTPRAESEPGLRRTIEVLEYCVSRQLLPVVGRTRTDSRLLRLQALEYALDQLQQTNPT